MAAQQITLNAILYDVYVIVSQADEFLAADVLRFTAWAALSTDEKGQAIITATRRLDRLKWVGVETDLVTPQPLDWPRTGATDCDGNAIGTTVVPDEIDQATMLLAADIASKPKLGDDTSTNTNLKRALAGSVEVEFFKQNGGLVLPNNIMELVSCLLSGGADAALSVATGTDADLFTGNNGFCRTDGFS